MLSFSSVGSSTPSTRMSILPRWVPLSFSSCVLRFNYRVNLLVLQLCVCLGALRAVAANPQRTLSDGGAANSITLSRPSVVAAAATSSLSSEMDDTESSSAAGSPSSSPLSQLSRFPSTMTSLTSLANTLRSPYSTAPEVWTARDFEPLGEFAARMVGLRTSGGEDPEMAGEGVVLKGEDVSRAAEGSRPSNVHSSSRGTAGSSLAPSRTFDPRDALAFFSPLPKPRRGTCQAGKSYTIKSGVDLRNHETELECLFQLGVVPKRPPVGMWYGGVISLLNTGVYSGIGESIWLGKMGFKTQCRDDDSSFAMIMNFILGDLGFPAYVYLGTLRDPILPGEVDNKKEYLFIDYTVNFGDLCPVGADFELNGNIGGFSSIFPVSSVVDVARVVGFTPDGGQIILGKTFFRDIGSFPDIGDITIAWWFVINYDSGSYPLTLSPGQPLGPTETTFDYYYRGLFDAYGPLSHLFSLEALKTNPLQALQRIVYFLFLRPIAGIPPPANSDVASLVDEWPLAGNPSPGYEVEHIRPPHHNTKSGRVPSLPNPLGDPFDFAAKLAVLVGGARETASLGMSVDSSVEQREGEKGANRGYAGNLRTAEQMLTEAKSDGVSSSARTESSAIDKFEVAGIGISEAKGASAISSTRDGTPPSQSLPEMPEETVPHLPIPVDLPEGVLGAVVAGGVPVVAATPGDVSLQGDTAQALARTAVQLQKIDELLVDAAERIAGAGSTAREANGRTGVEAGIAVAQALDAAARLAAAAAASAWAQLTGG